MTTTKRTYQVKEVSRIAGISVRALHHYDEIGLLVPSGRSEANYRLYTDDDLLRLQEIAVGRALGLSLEEIRRSLDDPRFDRRTALLAQRDQLVERAHETAAMIAAVDKALAVLDGGEGAGEMDMTELFDGFDPAQYEEEAKQKWGDTDAYRESRKRTKKYGKKEWQQLKEEQARIYADLFAALQAGKKPSDDDVMDIADRARMSIDRWFYPCSVAMHAKLADLYENDERFAANIDKHGAGLTVFLCAAIRANAKRFGAATA